MIWSRVIPFDVQKVARLAVRHVADRREQGKTDRARLAGARRISIDTIQHDSYIAPVTTVFGK